MAEAGKELRSVIDEVEFTELKVPYAANLTGGIVRDAKEIPDLLEKQVSGSVRMQQDIEALAKAGVDTFIEIGPGKTISGFEKKTLSDVEILNVETLEDVKAVAARIKEKAEEEK